MPTRKLLLVLINPKYFIRINQGKKVEKRREKKIGCFQSTNLSLCVTGVYLCLNSSVCNYK